MNKIIVKKNIENYITNYIQESEGNTVYSSVLYHYYNLLNHKEPIISYKSFISLFYKVYEKQKNKALQKSSVRYENTTLRSIENIALIIPKNFAQLLNNKDMNKQEVVTKNILEPIIIPEVIKINKNEHSKTMFDINMSEWLSTYNKPSLGAKKKASLFIEHYSDKYLNGMEINGNYNQFFFNALKREAKLLWPDIEIKNENPSKKKGSAIIINLDFK